MPKRRPATRPSVKRLGKRAAAYALKLETLRKLSDRFDAKKLDKLYATRPRSVAGKRAKTAALKKVSGTYKRVKLYLTQEYKIVRPRAGKHSARNLEELRKYAGFVKIKGLRGVPVLTAKPKKTRVSFDRDGRPTIVVGGRSQKFFRFPHMPRSGDELIGFVEQMLADKALPQGFYIMASRHAFLIAGGSFMVDRDGLLKAMRDFVYQYGADANVIRMVFGLKWLTNSDEKVFQLRREMADSRERARTERKRLRAERKMREIRAMHKKFTGEVLPPSWQEKKHKLARLSERARKTGRR